MDIQTNILKLSLLNKNLCIEHQRESQILDMKYADIILKLLKEKSILQTQMQVNLNTKIEKIHEWLLDLKIQQKIFHENQHISNIQPSMNRALMNNNNIIINSPIIINTDIHSTENKISSSNEISMPMLSPIESSTTLSDNNIHQMIENVIKNVAKESHVNNSPPPLMPISPNSNVNDTVNSSTRLQSLFSAINQMECMNTSVDQTKSMPFVRNIQTINFVESPSTVLTTVDNVKCCPYVIQNKKNISYLAAMPPTVTSMKKEDESASLREKNNGNIFLPLPQLFDNVEYGNDQFIISDDRRDMLKMDDNKFFTSQKVLYKGKLYIKCTECDRGALTIHDMYRHMRNSHMDEHPFKCEVCGKTFKKKMYLKHHKIIHLNMKPFECDFCQKRFRNKSDKSKHCEKKHNREIVGSDIQ